MYAFSSLEYTLILLYLIMSNIKWLPLFRCEMVGFLLLLRSNSCGVLCGSGVFMEAAVITFCLTFYKQKSRVFSRNLNYPMGIRTVGKHKLGVVFLEKSSPFYTLDCWATTLKAGPASFVSASRLWFYLLTRNIMAS